MKKSLGETLTALRRAAGLTQIQVSEQLSRRGIDIRTAGISKWEKGQTQPSASQFLALCGIYGVRDVMGVFTDAPRPADRLNDEGRRLVKDYVRVLEASGLYAAAARQAQRLLPLYTLAASAGPGQFLDDDDCDWSEAPEEVPETASFGVHIAGDSMEPRIADGSVVWVRRTDTLSSGHIGVFSLYGQAFCKRLEISEKGVFLRSENPAYAPIAVPDPRDLRVFGEVVFVSTQPVRN